MEPSPNLYPHIYRLLSCLEKEEDREIFEDALSKDHALLNAQTSSRVSPNDHALLNAQTSSGVSQRELARLDRKIDYLTTVMKVSTQAPPKTSHPQFYEINFGLRGRKAQAHINAMANASLVKTLEAAAPFNQVKACRIFATKLVLCVSSAEAEIAIHTQQRHLGPILGIPAEDCFHLPQTYEVQIINLRARENGQFANPKNFIAEWSFKNKVNITAARWTYKKLIWSLDRLGDAQKLVAGNGVTVSGIPAHAVPFDKRSTTKLCHTCGAPGHLKRQCMNFHDPVCLRCGQKMSTGGHLAWNGSCNKPERCINCGDPHAAWSPHCQDPRVKQAREEAQFYAQKKVFWEHYPRVDVEPAAVPRPIPAALVARGSSTVVEHSALPVEADVSSGHEDAAKPTASSASDYEEAAYVEELSDLPAQPLEESSMPLAQSAGDTTSPARPNVIPDDEIDHDPSSLAPAVQTEAAMNSFIEGLLGEQRHPKSAGVLAEEAAQKTTVPIPVPAPTTPIPSRHSPSQRESPSSIASTAVSTPVSQQHARNIPFPDHREFANRPLGPNPLIDKPAAKALAATGLGLRYDLRNPPRGPITRRTRGPCSGKPNTRTAGRGRGSMASYLSSDVSRNN